MVIYFYSRKNNNWLKFVASIYNIAIELIYDSYGRLLSIQIVPKVKTSEGIIT